MSKEEFLAEADHYGKPVFKRILDLAESHLYPIHWGTKGFSLNVDINGVHVVVCFGYPPNSVFKQSLYTGIVGRGGLLSKINASDKDAESMLLFARKTGLFQKAGSELKCIINREFSEVEMESLLNWVEKMAVTIRELGLRE